MVTPFQQNVYNAVKKIPMGRVTTYSAVARAIKKPQAVRAVGQALNKNPFSSVPCHRVIRFDGSMGGFARGSKTKLKLLAQEGIKVRGSNIDPSFILKSI